MPDALTLLDRDWPTYCSSPGATAAMRRWRSSHAIPPVPTLNALVDAMQDRDDPDGRDRLVYRLAVLASEDRDACRVVLAAVRPGLNRVAQTYCRWWGWEETASMTVAAALERIVTYPASRVDRPAANIVRDVQNRLHRARAREVTAEVKLGVRVSSEELDGVIADEIRSPADELAEVVDDAIESLRFSREEADLILRHRVHDVPTAQMAVERGHRVGTVRAHRRVAEERLTLITRSSRGLHGAVA